MATIEALDKGLVQLRMRYAKTPLPKFFSWWARELLACLPARWRNLLAERSEPILIEKQDRTLVLRRQSGSHLAELGQVNLEAPPEQQKAEFERIYQSMDDPNLRVFYCISSNNTLRRSLTLPAATEDNLRQVLTFEMDRQTPFKSEQVYFDYHIAGRDPRNRNVQVELIVVPRGQLDGDLALLAGSGIALDGVDCWIEAAGEGRLEVNLLPPEHRARRRNLRLLVNLILAAAVLGLLIFVMAQSLSNRETALAAMRAEVEKEQDEAKQVMAARKKLADTVTSANFLNLKKRESPVMVALLSDLTKRLPDDTFLERLNVDEKGKIEITGQSNDASKLIDSLKQSEILDNPNFQGTIQPDPRTKKERFNLVVEFKKPASKNPEHDGKGKDRKEGGANAPIAGSP